jgi:hypothetical protein
VVVVVVAVGVVGGRGIGVCWWLVCDWAWAVLLWVNEMEV